MYFWCCQCNRSNSDTIRDQILRNSVSQHQEIVSKCSKTDFSTSIESWWIANEDERRITRINRGALRVWPFQKAADSESVRT